MHMRITSLDFLWKPHLATIAQSEHANQILAVAVAMVQEARQTHLQLVAWGLQYKQCMYVRRDGQLMKYSITFLQLLHGNSDKFYCSTEVSRYSVHAKCFVRMWLHHWLSTMNNCSTRVIQGKKFWIFIEETPGRQSKGLSAVRKAVWSTSHPYLLPADKV